MKENKSLYNSLLQLLYKAVLNTLVQYFILFKMRLNKQARKIHTWEFKAKM